MWKFYLKCINPNLKKFHTGTNLVTCIFKQIDYPDCKNLSMELR